MSRNKRVTLATSNECHYLRGIKGGGGVLRTYHGLKVKKKKRIAVNKNPCSRFTAIFENSFIFIVVVVDRMRFVPFCGLF